MMGSGKSTVGEALAKSQQVPFVDLDAVIVDREGRSIAAIFARQGEAAFRALESRVLADVIQRAPTRYVLSLGGGSVLEPANRDLLRRSAWVVWMDGPVSLLYQRALNDMRPLAQSGLDAFARLYLDRKPLYEEVSHRRLDVADKSVDTLVQEVSRWWRERNEAV